MADVKPKAPQKDSRRAKSDDPKATKPPRKSDEERPEQGKPTFEKIEEQQDEGSLGDNG